MGPAITNALAVEIAINTANVNVGAGSRDGTARCDLVHSARLGQMWRQAQTKPITQPYAPTWACATGEAQYNRL